MCCGIRINAGRRSVVISCGIVVVIGVLEVGTGAVAACTAAYGGDSAGAGGSLLGRKEAGGREDGRGDMAFALVAGVDVVVCILILILVAAVMLILVGESARVAEEGRGGSGGGYSGGRGVRVV